MARIAIGGMTVTALVQSLNNLAGLLIPANSGPQFVPEILPMLYSSRVTSPGAP